MFGFQSIRLLAYAFGTAGGLSGAAYGLLNEQSRRARKVIGPARAQPLRADGMYLPDGSGPFPRAAVVDALELALLGDSTAAGLGVEEPDELPGVRIARGVAEELQRPVVLTTHAVVGTTSRRLRTQVQAALTTRPRLALILIGANDVTSKQPARTSARLLGETVSALTDRGVAVVAGTCPDLGAIRPIPQPLRAVARSWSLALGRAQRREVEAAGGRAVPLADLLAPEFLTRPSEMFSPDNFHPSAAGYAATVDVLLPVLCDAIGEWAGGPVPRPPVRSTAAEARRPTRRIVARLNRRLARRASADR